MMARRPTYEELQQRIKGLENEAFERKRIEVALQENEEKLRTITDTAVDSIFCKDINQRYTFVNPAMLRLLGCIKANLIGKIPEEVFDKEAAAIVTEIDERTLNGENVSEVRSLSVAGKPYVFHTIQVPLLDSDGNITGISGIVRDTTDFEQAREALQNAHREMVQKVEERTAGLTKTTEQLKALMNATTDTALLLDLKGCVVAANAISAKRFGITLDQLLGTCTYDLMSPSLAKSRKAKTDRVVKTGKPHRFEDDRKGIIFDSTIYPVFDEQGTVAQLAVYGKDITKQVKTYRELEEKEKDLEEKTTLLQDANIALKIMLQKSSENRKDVEADILTILKKRIAPYISKLKQCELDKNMRDYVHMLESNLKEIVSPFSRDLSFEYIDQTAKELRIANLIKENKITKQISVQLTRCQKKTINHHRNTIRNQFEIKNKKNH